MGSETNLMWFLKPKLSKKRIEEFENMIENLVEEKYQLRSISCDSFYSWAKNKIAENFKFGKQTARLVDQQRYADEIVAIQKTLEIYETHVKERGKI